MKKIMLTRLVVKPLMLGKSSSTGRNSTGRIVMWHRGGGYKSLYRIVNFTNMLQNIPFIVRCLEYDPNRNTFLALLCSVSGILTYILAYNNIFLGDIVIVQKRCYRNRSLKTGNGYKLSSLVKKKLLVHCIGAGWKNRNIFARSSGTICFIMSRFSWFYSALKLPSKEERFLLNTVTSGFVGKVLDNCWFFDNKLKAGRVRNMGFRPVVRGIAMNPVDHPHGGGDGKGKGSLPRSPWGWLTKCARKHVLKRLIIKRRVAVKKKK